MRIRILRTILLMYRYYTKAETARTVQWAGRTFVVKDVFGGSLGVVASRRRRQAVLVHMETDFAGGEHSLRNGTHAATAAFPSNALTPCMERQQNYTAGW